MRPQQNRRMRGRGTNNNNNNNNGNNQNRKGPNPLTRSYESNGPDVKIRGSAQQIAEKYTTLARDAQSSGDRVMAENYLQHAEHYNRIIMAAMAQMPQPQVRDSRDDDEQDEDGDDNNQNQNNNHSAQPSVQNEQPAQPQGAGPQPVIEGTPAEVALKQDGASEPTQPVAEAMPEAAEGEVAEAAPRRPRRPRRPRVKAGEEAAAEGGEPSTDEPVTEAAQ